MPPPINTTNPVNALVAFDTYDDDFNGVIFDSIHDAIEENLPVFCERRLFMGETFSPYHKHSSNHTVGKIRDMLIRGNFPFDVFADKASEEQLVILPKVGKKISGDLRTLGVDFCKVRWLSSHELLCRKSIRRSHIDDFIQIFDPNSHARLRFVLTGHGDRHLGVSGLNLSDYGRFLTFLQHKNTDALYIQTCNAGGANRIYHPPTPFPVFIENIGEFRSYYDGRSYRVIFTNLQKSLSPPHMLTHEIAADIFRSNTWIAYWQNLLQLRLPYARFFYPLNEDSSALVINKSCNNVLAPLQVRTSIRLVDLIVHRITRPLFLEFNQPIFLSLFSMERPLHIFDSIHSKLEILTLFQKTLDTFKGREVGDHQQLLFIKKLTAQGQHYENVLVVCSRKDHKILVYNKTARLFTHYHPGYLGVLKPHIKPQHVFFRTIRCILPTRVHSEIV